MKAVIFDLGGVVLGSPLEGIAEYEAQTGLPSGFVNIFITAKGRQGAFQRLERGEISVSKFLVDFKAEVEAPEAIDLFVGFVNRNKKEVSREQFPHNFTVDVGTLFGLMMEKSRRADRDMLQALFVLRGKGLKTCALTNNFVPIDDENNKEEGYVGFQGLKNYFDLVIESVVEGIRKPDPKIFQLAAKRLGLKESECVFLDDIGINVKGAQKVGMQAIKVDLGKAREALGKLETILEFPKGTLLAPVSTQDYERPVTLAFEAGAGNPPGKIVCDMFGCAADIPVVFFHGGGQTRHSWGRTGPDLAKLGFCVITVDLKGHGDSYWDRATTDKYPYSYAQIGQDIDRLISRMGMQNRAPILVGASLGGQATISSKSGQSLAGGVILVDVAPKLEIIGVDRVMGFMEAHLEDGFASLSDAAKAIAEYTSHRVRKAGANHSEASQQSDNSLEGLKKNLRFNEEKKRWFFHYDPMFVKQGRLNEGDLEYIEGLLTSCAKAMEPPVLLVRGKLTDILSDEGVSRLLKTIPQCEFVDVEQAGHMIAGDRNDVFLDTITTWILKHRQSLQKKNIQSSSGPVQNLSSKL